jgi:hypothetical protein
MGSLERAWEEKNEPNLNLKILLKNCLGIGIEDSLTGVVVHKLAARPPFWFWEVFGREHILPSLST